MHPSAIQSRRLRATERIKAATTAMAERTSLVLPPSSIPMSAQRQSPELAELASLELAAALIETINAASIVQPVESVLDLNTQEVAHVEAKVGSNNAKRSR